MAMSIAQPYRNRQRQVGPESVQGGYQNPGPSEGPLPWEIPNPRNPQIPPPANDNVPIPANDNTPTVREIPINPDGVIQRAAIRTAIRVVAGRTAFGRILDLTYTTLSLIDQINRNQYKRDVIETWGAWCIKRDCRWKYKYDGPSTIWLGGPGGCDSYGTVCQQQGGIKHAYPADTNYPPSGAGIVVGPDWPPTGNMLPRVWLGRVSSHTVAPFVHQVPDWFVRPVTPVVRDPWFLPIGQPVVAPPHSHAPGLPENRPRPTEEISSGSYGSTVSAVDPVPVTPSNPRPPTEGEKEKKGKISKAISIALKVAFEATEAIDFIDAVFDALPKKYHKGRLTPQAKLRLIYLHSDEIDLNKMVLNVLANHYSDLVIGRLSAITDAELQARGVNGFGRIGNI